MIAAAFNTLTDELLALYQPPLSKKGTFDKVRQVLREVAALGTVRTTADLNPVAIAAWVKAHANRSAQTNHSLLRSLRTCCRYARMMGYMAVDPFEWRSPAKWLHIDAETPPARRRDDLEDDDLDDDGVFRRNLSASQVRAILSRADAEAGSGCWSAGRLQALVYALAFTGMRKKELLGMAARDVRLEKRFFRIRANERRDLKTRGSAAPLGIPEPLAAVLALWLPRTGCEWLFPGSKREGPWLHGGPGVRALDQVKALGERAGVNGVTLLSFRHTIGTLSETWGLSELELQRWLRHTRRRTQDNYRHANLETVRAIAGKIQFQAPSSRTGSNDG